MGSNDIMDVFEQTFSVYSHETANAVYIDLHTENSNVFYVVYNKKGQIVKENHNLDKRNTLSLHPLPSGFYTIEVKDKMHTVTKNVFRL